MRRVGVREFRDHATEYLAGSEVLTIERHGQPIGMYIPTKARKERSQESFERLNQIVQRVLDQTGLSEEELSRFFDLSQPMPDLPPRRHATSLKGADAPGS